MNTEQIRIAVAECLGWKTLEEESTWSKGLMLTWHIDQQGLRQAPPPPNYPASLDACAQFEKTFSAKERELYAATLVFLQDDVGEWSIERLEERHWTDYSCSCLSKACFATALQRCEAFLRVTGKWTE